MLASKGILSALRRIPHSQSALPRLPSRQFSSLRPSTRPQFPRASRPTLPLTTLRFNSTLPTTTTLPTPTAVAGAEAAGTIPAHTTDHDLSYIPSAESLTPAMTTSEHPGFLKELGLDYGNGPTNILQHLLENVHLLTDTPWWTSIMLTVLAIRVLQFPFYMKMSDTTARMKEVNHLVVPLTKKMREAQQRGDKMGMIMTKQQVGEIYKKAGVNRLWILFPITQIPIFYGFYKNLYGMAELKVPGLVEGGAAWFHDLTSADPYYILPLVSSLSMGLQIWLGGEAGTSMQTRRMKQGMVIGLPLVSLAFVHSWPAALTLYFFTNSAFGLFQATSLRNAWVREKLGLYPLDPEAAKNPLVPKGGAESGLSALNLATRAGPAGKVVELGAPKQIGAKGGFLDRVTGGVTKDGKKKTLMDRVLGEKVEGEQGGIGQMLKDNTEKAKYQEYENKRKKRLEQEAAEERARRRNAGLRP